ncbi:MAG: hypothetical protein HRT58_01630 [Crocinitomicaceae bacterium]|nr:hypothetical protein [Flavobacteriales bacterium]NQZ34325.1 hypothetical protein [Crocinitomicaceae bacterium]
MTEIIEQPKEDKRPVMLLVLSILSFISIGIGLLAVLFSFVIGPMNDDQLLVQRVEIAKQKTEFRQVGMSGFTDILDKSLAIIEETNDSFYLANSILFLTYIIGLFGVIMMLRRRKLGFHLYIIYSLLALSGLYIYVSAENVPMIATMINLAIAGLFVFLYSRTLRWMR